MCLWDFRQYKVRLDREIHPICRVGLSCLRFERNHESSVVVTLFPDGALCRLATTGIEGLGLATVLASRAVAVVKARAVTAVAQGIHNVSNNCSDEWADDAAPAAINSVEVNIGLTAVGRHIGVTVVVPFIAGVGT